MQEFERGQWPAPKDEAKKQREALARLQEERKRGCIVVPVPARQVVDDPVWDNVRRKKADDDFEALTWMAYLCVRVGSTLQATATYLFSFLKNAVAAAQYHWHYETCKKNGHDGTDESCRLEQPRLIVPQSR